MATCTPHESHDQQKKSIGCIAGFLNLHRRILPKAGKRLYPKPLPPSPGGGGVDFSSEAAASSIGSPAFSAQLIKVPAYQQPKPSISPSRSRPPPAPAEDFRTPVPESRLPSISLSSFEFKDGGKSMWKFARDAPRLSLDSRFVVDAEGSLRPREIRTRSGNLSGDENDNQRRSPSVVARLMGIEHPLPRSDGGSGGAESPAARKVELRRSASESRSRDQMQYPLFDCNSHFSSVREFNNMDLITRRLSPSTAKLNQPEHSKRALTVKPDRARERRPLPQQQKQRRKMHYNIADSFPEPKRTPLSMHGEMIDRRLKARGIEEPSKDLETLKQILEAIQLKGLLHSKPSEEANSRRRNFVNDYRGFLGGESPVVVMMPAISPSSRRSGNEYPAPSIRSKTMNSRNLNQAGEALASRSPRRERPNANRNGCLQSPIVATARRKPAALSTERPRGGRESHDTVAEQKSGSPVRSPRLGTARRLDQRASSRSPRGRRPTAEIHRSEKSTVREEDEWSSVSESSYNNSCSHQGTERWKMEEEYSIAGSCSLLERCDGLLHSIAEMTATNSVCGATTINLNTTTGTTTELQPSPVSVLDSSFYKEEDDSPSPVIMKRTIDFQDAVDQVVEAEDELTTVVQFNESDTSDLAYISKILYIVSSDHYNYLNRDEYAVFQLLEQEQLLHGKGTISKSSRVQRRLVFDSVNEILNRSQKVAPSPLREATILPTPVANSVSGKPSLRYVWSELQRIREPCPWDIDLLGTITEVLKRDLARDWITGWGDFPEEMSDMVLDIERMMFKDLIGEAIIDFAAVSASDVKCVVE